MSEPKLTRETPNTIYLQDGCDDPDCDEHIEYEGVTWCADPIHDNDTKYIRADLHEAALAAEREAHTRTKAALDSFTITQTSRIETEAQHHLKEAQVERDGARDEAEGWRKRYEQEREAHAETKQTLRDYTHPTVAVDTVQNLEDALSRERAKRKELARQLFRIEQTEIAQTIKQIDNTIEENRSLMNMVRQERAARERAEADNLRLRKIAAHVPAKDYIKAKEAAGFGTVVRAAMQEEKPQGTNV